MDRHFSKSKLKQIFQFKDPESPRKQTKRASAFLEESSSAGCSHKIAPSSVALQVEVNMLRSQVSMLEKHLSNATKAFSFDSVKGDSTLVEHYTGLPSADVFILLQLCNRFDFSYYCGWKVSSISQQDQLFLTQLKLHCNCSSKDLGVRFSVSINLVQ